MIKSLPVTALSRLLLLTATLLAVLMLDGCSTKKEDLNTLGEERLWDMGQKAITSSNWPRSIQLMQQIEAQFPFGRYASQSQLLLIYAYYMNSEPDACRTSADRFIRLYPDHPNIDYAYYLKGMAFYSEDNRILGRWLPTDPSKRDPGRARESFGDFSALLSMYPKSPYANDARFRMVYLRNMLAGYEINVAEFYIERQAYLAALNRSRYIVENYQGAPQVKRALEIMTEMYLRLGLNDLADQSLAVLKANHPDSSKLNKDGNFLVETQITDPSLLYSVTFGLVGSNKKDTPLAPTRRPTRAETYNFDMPVVERKRSLLNILTFGMLGDPGTPKITTTK
ncbi:MAG TPA: outer membrane protein assembly factor BamD [Candidatus Acidoferrum sp.]|nr:outer membrane protein assembly factor BamD [Candidatus Acidoferrum sp.]